MPSPSEEVFVVEHLVQDDMGCFWKPVFTHTKLAVALGKLADQGPHYVGTREATRLRVYEGTPTVISRADMAEVHARLLQECRVVGDGRAHAGPESMVAYVVDNWVALGCDPLLGEYAATVERNREALDPVVLAALEGGGQPPLEVLYREFEYASKEDIHRAEEALLKLSDVWVPKREYLKVLPKEKKPVTPLVAVEENRPCQFCGTKVVADFDRPGDGVCTSCKEKEVQQ